jgi:hypothetical protein
MYIKVVCDDRFDPDLSYEIEGETVESRDGDKCSHCPQFEECQGWKEIFGRCNK